MESNCGTFQYYFASVITYSAEGGVLDSIDVDSREADWREAVPGSVAEEKIEAA